MNVSQALRERYSVRSFTAQMPSAELVRQILEDSARAPSGGNVQPWHVVAVAGQELATLKKQIAAAPVPDPHESVLLSYPARLWEPYRTRRFENGEQMYAQVGITRENRAARMEHIGLNAGFFGAPVAIFVLVDDRMLRAQWLDLGCFVQSVALRATEEGLGTCIQGFLRRYNDVLRRNLGYAEELTLAYNIALGYPDEAAKINQFRTPRAPLHEWGELRGFE